VALRFKLDENVPRKAAALLRDAGHDVRSALEQALGGSSDEKVLAAWNEARILVTLDLDFGDIRAYPPASHAGIWGAEAECSEYRCAPRAGALGARGGDQRAGREPALGN
jgi:hypothetical protein